MLVPEVRAKSDANAYQRFLKKLAQANPNLTYPERKALMEQFVPENIQTESEIAQFFESGDKAIAAFVQQVSDDHCSQQIYDWA